MFKRLVSWVLVCVVLAACTPKTPAPQTTPAPPQIIPTETALLQPSPTPTAIGITAPGPTAAASATPPPPPSVTLVARLGRGIIEGADFSPDRATILIAQVGGIGLYSADTLREIWWLPTDAIYADSVSFSPEGTLFAAGMNTGAILICQVKTPGCQTLTQPQTDHPFSVYNFVRWSPDGKYISTEQRDFVQVLQVIGARDIFTIKATELKISSLAWSPDGSRLAISSASGTKIRDMATGKDVVTVSDGPGEISTFIWMRWSPDGRYMFTRRGYGGTHIFDAETGKPLDELDYVDSPAGIIPTGTRLYEFYAGIQSDIITSIISPDKTGLLVFLYDGQLLRITRSTQAETVIASLGVQTSSSAAWSPDSKLLAVVSTETGVVVWDVSSSMPKSHLDLPSIYRAEWSPDGRLLALGTDSGITLWDWQANDITHILHGYNEGNLHNSTTIAFSPDGTLLATGFENRAVLWSIKTGVKVFELGEHPGPVIRVAWSPDGNLIAAADGTQVTFWKLDLPNRVTEMAYNTGPNWSSSDTPMMFSPNGDYVAISLAGSNRARTVVRNSGTFETIQQFDGVGPIGWMSGTQVMATDGKYPVRIMYALNIVTGEKIVVKASQMDGDFSANLRYELVGLTDPYTRVIDMVTSLSTKVGDRGMRGYPAFWSPDSHMVAIPSYHFEDGRTYVYRVH